MPENGLENTGQKRAVPDEVGKAGRVVSARPHRLCDCLRARIEACDLFDGLAAFERKRAGLPSAGAPFDFLGKALWIVFVLIVISGVGLLAGYSPTVTGAFSSVERMQTSFPMGWWLRGAHKYCTDLFVILALLRLVRIAYRRAYKSPAEISWISSLVVLAVGMVAGLTGYLLVWHQRAFRMGRIFEGDIMTYEAAHPLGGLGLHGWPAGWILGGDEISQQALMAIFVAHIALGFLLMLAALCWRVTARKKVPAYRHFSPETAWPLFWSILAAVTVVAILFPPPLGSPSDGLLKPHPILADWYLLGCYQLIDILTPPAAVSLILLGFVLGALIPWIDRSSAKGPRPLVTSIVTAGLATWLIFTLKGLGWSISPAGILGLTAVVWFIAVIVGAMGEARTGAGESGREVTGR